MIAWNILDAQTNFTKLLQDCINEPQILGKYDQPIAVIVNFTLFKELMELKTKTPTMAELIQELEIINAENPIDFTFPQRIDRSNSLLE